MTTSTDPNPDDFSDDFSFLYRWTTNPSGESVTRPARLLRFGLGPPIGTVEIISRERYTHLAGHRVFARHTARFDVLVPAAFSARLAIRPGICEPHRLAPLADWHPFVLDDLSLMWCTIGDPALRHIAGLSGLRYLDLYSTYVTDASGPVLAGLTGLEWLSLSYTRIGTRGVEHLGDLANLWRLSLRGTGITDNALVALARLPRLAWLSVADTAVTSYGLEHLLARAPALQWVAINGTPAACEPRTLTLPRRPGVEFIEH